MHTFLKFLIFSAPSLVAMSEENLFQKIYQTSSVELVSDVHDYVQAKQSLLQMAREDQDLRRAYLKKGLICPAEVAQKLNEKHIITLKEIIARYGWPNKQQFDEDCSFAAWMIAQHANHNIDFQIEARRQISYLNERFAPLYWVFLTDRILANTHQPQLYGTQYTKNGTLWPIYDPKNLNMRRQRMQLSPLEYYQDIMAFKFSQIKCTSALP